jgi:hypothetical protein
MKNIKTILIILFAAIGDVYIFSCIADLMRQPSDMAVAFGLVMVVGLIIGNYMLINYIAKTIKN